MDDLTVTPVEHQDDLNNLDPIGIETQIKVLEQREFQLALPLMQMRPEIAQLKRDLSITRAKYWRNK